MATLVGYSIFCFSLILNIYEFALIVDDDKIKINMRLTPYDLSLNNILVELFRGTHMKFLVQSFTGRKTDKFQSFDNMTKEQLQTRIKWIIRDLKEENILRNEFQVDTSLVAAKSAKHVSCPKF